MILIGFMGSGKSTVARALGEKLNLEVLELDTEINILCGKTIPEIFDEEGEPGFRKYEHQVLTEACGSDGIISTGGGIITYDDSYEIIRNTDRKVIFLNAAFDVLYARISGDKTRPLASQSKSQVRALYDSRIERYKNAADLEVDTARGLEETINTILEYTRL
ncbi:shikimate kinase [Salinicoccus sp. HZC-1]|uniref:shikimate kinase n=1 Tax=Salinicoccus sp. HZC-1 TaxID=3385497 RepID=UPI00398B1FD3